MIFIGAFIALFLAYVVGSVSTGFFIAKLIFGVDITQQGSGNSGATNTWRVLGGVRYFFLILLLDAGKACATLWLSDHFYASTFSSLYRDLFLLASAVCLLVGNSWSVFLRFKGGKGVATTLGIILYLLPLTFTFLFIVTWALMFFLTRKAFIASLVSLAELAIIYGLVVGFHVPMFPFLLFLFLWSVVCHRTNIRNMI